MPTGERFRSGDDASMKSYGMPDESWDEAKIRALIKEAIHATRKRGIPVAVHQDERGDVVMSRARIKHSFMYACVAIAYVDKRTMGYATELTGNVPHERYTVGQMIPRMRDALVRGIFEYGASGSSQTVQKHARWAVRCAERLARMRKEPFIAGVTDNGITVAPLSERYRFVEQAACVFNGHEAWSLPDSITSWSVPLDRLHKARHPDVMLASDLRSILIRDPARRVYRAVMDTRSMRNEAEWRARRARDEDAPTEP